VCSKKQAETAAHHRRDTELRQLWNRDFPARLRHSRCQQVVLHGRLSKALAVSPAGSSGHVPALWSYNAKWQPHPLCIVRGRVVYLRVRPVLSEAVTDLGMPGGRLQGDISGVAQSPAKVLLTLMCDQESSCSSSTRDLPEPTVHQRGRWRPEGSRADSFDCRPAAVLFAIMRCRMLAPAS
jgi:hypothetical protein